jgi:uncharacterized protein YbjT (DUF2867 family)
MATLLLVGATGLVGQSVLARALADPRVTKVVAPTRRPLPPGPKLENPVVDFDALPAGAAWWQADAVICTLGTTQKIAGSQAAFRKVDFDYPLAVAKLAHQHGTPAYALTSSVGAAARSPSFYLRTKGELEQALIGVGFPSLTIVRPSGIYGERNPPRPLESLGMSVMRHLGPIIPRRYRVVTPAQIAKALLQGALAAPPGLHFVESEAL